MPRRLAISKRVSLEGIGEGWGPECYALVNPCSYQERIELTNLQASESKVDVINYQIGIVGKRFISGKALFMGDGDKLELSDLTLEDVVDNEQLVDILFLAVMGVDTDPKGLSELRAKSLAQSPSSEPSDSTSNTKTQ